jgi:hypothetical protein
MKELLRVLKPGGTIAFDVAPGAVRRPHVCNNCQIRSSSSRGAFPPRFNGATSALCVIGSEAS